MSDIIIFGAGGTGRLVYKKMKHKYNVVGFADNDMSRWDRENIDGKPVFAPYKIKRIKFDYIVLGTFMGCDEIRKQLEEMGITDEKIIPGYVETSVNARIFFLKRTAEEAYRRGLTGSVAEAGVFRGEFAKEINRYYSDKKCYLFDTFEGFSDQDIAFEKEKSLVIAEYMKGLSENIVYDKMPYKENVEIRKGYFPETAVGITDEFCFVNLDMDLYKPIYEGIVFFYPKLVSGGTLLIHDYFSEAYPNVRQAVEDYEKGYGIKLITTPIGDDMSIAIIKP